eukprot:g1795.t1
MATAFIGEISSYVRSPNRDTSPSGPPSGPIIKRRGYRDSVETRDEAVDGMRGYLYKQAHSRFSQWQKRWFVCDNHYLRYYARKDDADRAGQPQASIDLNYVSHVIYLQGEEFLLHGPHCELAGYRLRADDSASAARWVRVIGQHINMAGGSTDDEEDGDVDEDDSPPTQTRGLEGQQQQQQQQQQRRR